MCPYVTLSLMLVFSISIWFSPNAEVLMIVAQIRLFTQPAQTAYKSQSRRMKFSTFIQHTSTTAYNRSIAFPLSNLLSNSLSTTITTFETARYLNSLLILPNNLDQSRMAQFNQSLLTSSLLFYVTHISSPRPRTSIFIGKFPSIVNTKIQRILQWYRLTKIINVIQSLS